MIAVPKRREDYFRNFFASQKRKLKRVCQKFRLLFHNHPSRPTCRSCPPRCGRPRRSTPRAPSPREPSRPSNTALILGDSLIASLKKPFARNGRTTPQERITFGEQNFFHYNVGTRRRPAGNLPGRGRLNLSRICRDVGI
jgi:hypothetical protein